LLQELSTWTVCIPVHLRAAMSWAGSFSPDGDSSTNKTCMSRIIKQVIMMDGQTRHGLSNIARTIAASDSNVHAMPPPSPRAYGLSLKSSPSSESRAPKLSPLHTRRRHTEASDLLARPVRVCSPTRTGRGILRCSGGFIRRQGRAIPWPRYGNERLGRVVPLINLSLISAV
jgi:hypothetical protein